MTEFSGVTGDQYKSGKIKYLSFFGKSVLKLLLNFVQYVTFIVRSNTVKPQPTDASGTIKWIFSLSRYKIIVSIT